MPYHLPTAWLRARVLRTNSLAVTLAGDIGTLGSDLGAAGSRFAC